MQKIEDFPKTVKNFKDLNPVRTCLFVLFFSLTAHHCKICLLHFQAVRAMLTSNHFFPLDLEVCLPWRRRTSQSTPSPSNCLAASKAIWTDLECATMVIWFPKAKWEREWENMFWTYPIRHVSYLMPSHYAPLFAMFLFNDCWTAFVVHIQMNFHFNMAYLYNGSCFVLVNDSFIPSYNFSTTACRELPVNKWLANGVAT